MSSRLLAAVTLPGRPTRAGGRVARASRRGRAGGGAGHACHGCARLCATICAAALRHNLPRGRAALQTTWPRWPRAARPAAVRASDRAGSTAPPRGGGLSATRPHAPGRCLPLRRGRRHRAAPTLSTRPATRLGGGPGSVRRTPPLRWGQVGDLQRQPARLLRGDDGRSPTCGRGGRSDRRRPCSPTPGPTAEASGP